MSGGQRLSTALFAGLAVLVALLLQTTVAPHLAWRGVGPDLVLLVVVGIGLARGAQDGLVVGFCSGLLLDLAPPADHVAGRWALALLVVGYVAGRVRVDVDRVLGWTPWATAVACSFLGTSVFALTGLVLQDPPVGVGELLPVVLLGVAWDALLAIIVLPLVLVGFRRLAPDALPHPVTW